jgi:hypothetical protein
VAEKDPDPIKEATPETGDDGITRGTHSTAAGDVDTEARAKAADLSNLQAPTADVEDTTPAKLRDYYKTEIKAQRVAPSLTGLETRIRRDYEAAGKGISDEKLRELASEILGR